MFYVLFPVYPIVRTPDIVVEIAHGSCRRIVGASTQNPHPVVVHRGSADHPSGHPQSVLGNLGPVYAIVRTPHVVVEDLVGVGKVRNGLSAHHPDPAVES